ncbi:hypothetical protein J5N97_003497 [Dioscorea zingiberensis]|uniref:Uncharacterized protein n=1 Tax=Dioscorea zingiberensis TaxID=325984 RepID=A0A9D5HQK8_9LILI|nr:hypothetical protein J5N97_003497 [Dioscorea zingiberensis]
MVLYDADVAGNWSLGIAFHRRRSRLLAVYADVLGLTYRGVAAYDLRSWEWSFLTQLASQVLNIVEDASNVCKLVSKCDGHVTFLQMHPIPLKPENGERFRAFHPLLLVEAGDETNGLDMVQGDCPSVLIGEPQPSSCISTLTVVGFLSLKSHNYVHVLRFQSAVYMIRCSPRIVSIAPAAQIYCFDAENKLSVLTYPLQGAVGVDIGYKPMAVGPR